ncbi:hypothetical protein SSP24_79340 [Streptomyces spinoverrucosus]|uniref:DUF4232 domain-containing protein n=1 Tax=Streptomyces spinoverrucosus TaxID=284043 RepID=A0A4Y3VX43_9ACTN|nr:DUF4232 domain-containing protein [Streptomyces spinoverrucosus]GEC10279.1 hypothetical protein SSP24_79340 [Streptomyces spinoverrucosus]GHB81410.1 hypothetical protein GCM10010397_60560 [Streptomyces spinoverrucosus]
MRATSLTVGSAALAAALLLTACGGGEGDSGGQDTSACALDEVGVEIGPANAAPVAGDTGNIPVTVTNEGAECTLDGFPAVDLNAEGTSATVPADKAAKPQKLTLAKDTAATFTITYVRGEAGGDLDATTVKIALPGAPATQSFEWSYGPVALVTGGAPDATVGAFQQAGD